MPWTFKVIPSSVKETVLKQVKEDGRSIADAAKEFGISTKTIYNWLGSDVDETGKSASSYLAKIHRLEQEKKDLVQIIWAFSVVVERLKKKDEEDSARTFYSRRKKQLQ